MAIPFASLTMATKVRLPGLRVELFVCVIVALVLVLVLVKLRISSTPFELGPVVASAASAPAASGLPASGIGSRA